MSSIPDQTYECGCYAEWKAGVRALRASKAEGVRFKDQRDRAVALLRQVDLDCDRCPFCRDFGHHPDSDCPLAALLREVDA